VARKAHALATLLKNAPKPTADREPGVRYAEQQLLWAHRALAADDVIELMKVRDELAQRTDI
jgi:hypothetical protein